MTSAASRKHRARRLRVLLLAAVLLATAGFGAIYLLASGSDEGPPGLPARVHPLLPDLSIAPIAEITPALAQDGRRFLRFGVTIVNIGSGTFLVDARRSNFLTGSWRVRQQVPEAEGGFTVKDTEATLVFAGDGHDHWHIRDVEGHQIERPDGTVVGQVIKSGFCFFDTTRFAPELPGAPSKSAYFAGGCGRQSDTHAFMGLSIGWGDEYPWHLFDQQIDISGLEDGRYRLRAIADPFGWFDELDETNNEVWADIEIESRDGFPFVNILGTSWEGTAAP
jgi:hypothetical protein